MPARRDDDGSSVDRERDLIQAARVAAFDCSSQGTQVIREASAATAVATLPADLFPGYRIEREIHRGGQGVVYLAMQHATRRQVAIKVTREGPFASPGDRARFEREVHVLAQIKHPNIVTIHDSSESAGLHYFVMDYVSGVPLDKYVAARRLSVKDTLRLLARVCRAVNAAHLRGVIHRDLKPGNILIDEQGDPRVLDFGLAKLDRDEADQTRTAGMTQTGQFIGTMPWASPEQAIGAHEQIDLRTDVYSLGVMLFQALTRHFPYRVVGNAREVITQITETAPVRPTRYRSEIDSDAETIVLKCLAKEPDRRYQSAAAIADDIDRYLTGEPILARPSSAAYHFRKLMMRHRLSSALVAALLVCIVGFAVWMTYLYRTADQLRGAAQASAGEARSAADKATQVSQFLADLFKVPPGKYLDRGVTARELLDIGRGRIVESLRDQPEVRAALLQTVGEAYSNIGILDEAETLMSEALQIRRQVLDPLDDDLLQSIEAMAGMQHSRARHAAAAELYHELVELRRAKWGDGHPDVAAALARWGEQLYAQGEVQQAEAVFDESLEIYQELEDDPAGMSEPALALQGDMYRLLDRPAEAERCYRQILALYENGLQGLNTADMMYSARLVGLAHILVDKGDHAAAVDSARKAVDLVLKVHRLGEDHPVVAEGYKLIAEIEAARRNWPAAEEAAERAVAICTERFGLENANTVEALTRLGDVQQGKGEYEKADATYRQALGLLVELDGPSAYLQSKLQTELAVVLGNLGEIDEAERLPRKTQELNESHFGHYHHTTARSVDLLANLLYRKGDLTAAAEKFEIAAEIRRRVYGDDDPSLAAILSRWAEMLRRTERTEEAETLYREALAIMENQPEAEQGGLGPILCNLGLLLTGEGQFAEAADLYRQALDFTRRTNGPGNAVHTYPMLGLSLNLRYLGEGEESGALAVEALELARKALGDDHAQTATMKVNLAATHLADGQEGPAEPLLRQAIAVFEQTLPSPDFWYGVAQSLLGEVLTNRGDYDQAERLLLGGREWIDTAAGEWRLEVEAALQRLIKLYDARGDRGLADRYRVELQSERKP
jgi:tetratricopeptide (TPR) repeat protein